MTPTRERLSSDLLHLLGLTLLAVAQPLFALLGEHATFFVAHRADRPALLLWTAAVSLAPWAVLALLEGAVAAVAPRRRRALHLALVAALAALALLPACNRLLDAHAGWAAAGAAGGGLAFAAAYAALPPVRLFATLLACGSLALPVLFLTTTPAARLHRGAAKVALESPPPSRPHPIVMVVFDELSLVSLLDDTGAIDARRFPNFAALAATADWYAGAGTVSDRTNNAVPSLLDGRRPRDPQVVPTHAAFPSTLFTLLAGSYRLNVHETITWLCPRELCGEQAQPPGRVLPELLADSAVVYAHAVAPASLRGRLPPIGQGWSGFVRRQETPDGARGMPAWLQFVGESSGQDRRVLFRRFVQAIAKGDPPGLSFLHVLLPHVAYSYLPSTHAYPAAPLRGLGSDGETWVGDEGTIKEAYQRYLLQLGFVDAMLGELIAKLRRDGLFDRTLLVVTADHGVAFRRGSPRRAVAPATAADIVAVPLLIKRPQQRRGRIVRAPAELIDVLPTMADVLGLRVPWQMDGVSLLRPRPRPLASRRIFTWHRQVIELPVHLDLRPSLARQVELFGTGREPFRLYSPGLAPQLAGRRVVEVAHAGAAPLRVEIDQAAELRAFAGGEPVPLPVTGRVELLAAVPTPLDLALVFNGRIVAQTRTFEKTGGHFFSAMVPEATLPSAAAGIDVYVVSGAVAGVPRLLAAGKAQPLRLTRLPQGGPEVLIGEEGSPPVPLRPEVLSGWTEFARVERDALAVGGWVFDKRREVPVRKVSLFLRGREVVAAVPELTREDVARHFGNEALRDTGFILRLRAAQLRAVEPSEVRVVGFADDGAAGELVLGGEARCSLAKAWWRLRGRTAPAAAPPRGGAAFAGDVESVAETSGCLQLRGWAFDTALRRPPARLVVMAGERVVLASAPNVAREDVAAYFHDQAARLSGFDVVVPTAAFAGPWRNSLQVVAVRDARAGGRLPIREAAPRP